LAESGRTRRIDFNRTTEIPREKGWRVSSHGGGKLEVREERVGEGTWKKGGR